MVSGVPDVAAALALTAAQQVAIGFSCNGAFATYGNPITACNGTRMSKLLTLPQTGAENDDHNPDRVRRATCSTSVRGPITCCTKNNAGA